MKLLIITQSVDKNNPVLGFMHRWIEEFAKKFEFITVICLEKGAYNLPNNVKVLSLGKEDGRSRIKYLFKFYKYIWRESRNYDAVFVHMNQEYVLLGAKLWWLMRKPVYMWRNHHSGNFLTDISAFFCKKIFCTSKYSYTAKYKKAVLMPVGIDMEVFGRENAIERKNNSILFLGRVAPVKRPDLFIDALSLVKDQEWSATIVGDALPKDQAFYQSLMAKVSACGLEDKIVFKKGLPNQDTASVYSANDIYVNLSSSGMYDKTIFEAMACRCIVLASNENLRGQIDDRLVISEGKAPDEVAEKIKMILELTDNEKVNLREQGLVFAKKHSLEKLAEALRKEIAL